MKFKEWLNLQETMTGSNCVAQFARMSIPLVRRISPGEFAMDHEQDEWFKKQREKRSKKNLSLD